jgi:hypothetical protein
MASQCLINGCGMAYTCIQKECFDNTVVYMALSYQTQSLPDPTHRWAARGMAVSGTIGVCDGYCNVLSTFKSSVTMHAT